MVYFVRYILCGIYIYCSVCFVRYVLSSYVLFSMFCPGIFCPDIFCPGLVSFCLFCFFILSFILAPLFLELVLFYDFLHLILYLKLNFGDTDRKLADYK